MVSQRLAAAIAALICLPGPAAVAAAPARAAPAADCLPSLPAQERRLILDALKADEDPAKAPDGTFSDADLKATLQRYAVMQLGLRVQPSTIDRLWAITPPARDVSAELQVVRSRVQLAAWLRALEAPHAGYRSLASERCRYVEMTDAGGWSALPSGGPLKERDTDPAVAALRARLRAEGYEIAAAEPPERFDAALAASLRAFQRRHDLREDGVLGPETRTALNLPAAARLAQIEANLERWRWLPHDLPADRLEVDVGTAEATLYVAAQPKLQMRVIVGDPEHKTPMFVSRLEAVVFNPPWNVPASIVRNEILPRAARDPGYLTRNQFVRSANGLQQRPGPKNALGQLKFDLPSPFGVYLHDTPGRAAFARSIRTLSHGCMRLEKPRDLAEELLGPEGWGRAKIDRTIATGATLRVALRTPMPLFVVYRTAVADPDGWAHFHPDPYGWDAKLTSALAGAHAHGLPATPASECSATHRVALRPG